MRNGPVIFLYRRFIHKVEIVGNSLLLVKVRTKVRAERQERNQSRVKANLELLRTGTFVTQDTERLTVRLATHAIHLVEGRGIITNFIRIRILHVNGKRVSVFSNLRNRITRNSHHAIARYIHAAISMVIIKDIVACKKTTITRGKEVLLHERFAVATTIHITLDVQRIACGKERENVPAHVQLMAKFRRVSDNLINLRFHEIRIAALVHIADIVQIENRKVKGLRPRFKFSLRQRLQPFKLRQTFERSELEHAERSQLIFKHRVVRISRVRRCCRTTF